MPRLTFAERSTSSIVTMPCRAMREPATTPTPSDVAFGIYADGAPSPFEEEGLSPYVLRFGVQGYQVSSWARKPASLTFVVDTSGSMYEGNRLEMVKYALNVLVNRLTGEDTVSIVAYGTEARVVLTDWCS